MPLPRLEDDGQSLTLDLHGLSVADALEIADHAVVQAARYGRQTVRLVHGSSTADRGVERTLKSALREALHDGAYDRHVTTSFEGETVLTLGLAPAPSPRPGRLSLSDLR